MDPKDPEGEEWTAADFAAMLTGGDARSFQQNANVNVEPAPGFQHGEGEYVIDPDYADILSLDYDDLIRRKVDIAKR